jgi:hypothetical protein
LTNEQFPVKYQVINTPTLTLPHQGGGNFSLHLLFSPPLVGGGWGEGDKKGNSYTIKIKKLKNLRNERAKFFF